MRKREPSPEEVEEAIHHVDSMGDTGVGYTPLGRVYAIKCMWCPDIFTGRTKSEALEKYRTHEAGMIRTVGEHFNEPTE